MLYVLALDVLTQKKKDLNCVASYPGYVVYREWVNLVIFGAWHFGL